MGAKFIYYYGCQPKKKEALINCIEKDVLLAALDTFNRLKSRNVTRREFYTSTAFSDVEELFTTGTTEMISKTVSKKIKEEYENSELRDKIYDDLNDVWFDNCADITRKKAYDDAREKIRNACDYIRKSRTRETRVFTISRILGVCDNKHNLIFDIPSIYTNIIYSSINKVKQSPYFITDYSRKNFEFYNDFIADGKALENIDKILYAYNFELLYSNSLIQKISKLEHYCNKSDLMKYQIIKVACLYRKLPYPHTRNLLVEDLYNTLFSRKRGNININAMSKCFEKSIDELTVLLKSAIPLFEVYLIMLIDRFRFMIQGRFKSTIDIVEVLNNCANTNFQTNYFNDFLNIHAYSPFNQDSQKYIYEDYSLEPNDISDWISNIEKQPSGVFDKNNPKKSIQSFEKFHAAKCKFLMFNQF